MPFEPEFGSSSGPSKKVIAIALILLLSVVSVAYAVYKITSSPSQPVTVTTPASLSAPTVNATSLIVGDTLQLTTQLSDHASNVQVFFYSNASQTALGSAYTDSNGQAIFNAVQSTPGVYTFTADCIHP